MADTCVLYNCISSVFHHCYKTETLNKLCLYLFTTKNEYTYLRRKFNILHHNLVQVLAFCHLAICHY